MKVDFSLTHKLESRIVGARKKKLLAKTICALNGIIASGPIALALSYDINIGSEQARFRIALTRVGLSLENGISYMLSQRTGSRLTLELAYTNDIIDAGDMAKKLFDIPPGLMMAKKCAYKALKASDLGTQIAFEIMLGKTLGQIED
jgi:hypothetical protein